MFEAISGLKVSFHKSMSVDINVIGSWLNEAASVLQCKIGKIPFVYLSVPIKGNLKCVSF